MHDVVVVGGGPAGSLAAAGLARDHDVMVIEEHSTSGLPVQCAGLISDDVIRMSGADPDILSTLYGAEVVFPNGTSVTVRSKRPKARAIDRAQFDRMIADAAMDAGAEFRYGEMYMHHHISDRVSVTTSRGSHEARSIVGADGHSSAVAASLGSNGPRENLRGIQADVSVRMEHQDMFRIHLGSELAPGFFTWEIPCGDFTRVGLCTSWSAGPPYQYLRRLLARIGAEDRVTGLYCGKIPLGGRRTTYGDRCLLVGDAAGQVKPVSAGGLFPGLHSAHTLSDVLSSALDDDDLSSRRLSEYQRRWRSDLRSELDRGYRLRRAFVRMDDDDLDSAGRFASRDDVRSILDDIDIDHPSDAAVQLMRHPRAALSAIPVLVRCLL